MHKLASPVSKINGYRVQAGMYEELHLPSDEQLREELERIADSWTTGEQKIGNALRRANTAVCPTCDGWGKERDKKGFFKSGCRTCLGVGFVEPADIGG